MNDLEKEHLLHKIIAASAFVFALMILPVAQYFLVSNKLPPEQGQVAGFSPEPQVTTQANVANPAECEAKKQQDLADLDRFYNGEKQAKLRDYEAAVAPYKQAQEVLQGEPEKVQQEKAALDGLIEAEYQPYIQKLTAIEQAVSGERQTIQSRSCS